MIEGAVNDTRYTGTLTLPTAVIVELGLSFSHMGWAFLANDDVVSFDEGRIEDGDVLLRRRQDQAEPGQIVVVVIDGDATVNQLVPGQITGS